MKQMLTLLLLLALCVTSSFAMAIEPVDPAATFDWMDHTLAVQSIRMNPDHIVDNPLPEEQNYVLLRIACLDGALAVGDLFLNLESICLEDLDEVLYNVCAIMPYSMTYSERNGVFATAMEQTQFDLFFVLPVAVQVEDLALYAGESELFFSDLDLEALVQ